MSYELGRIALDTHNVALSDDWLERAVALIRAYVAANAEARRSDIVFSARIWLIHLLRSLYGVSNHYRSPALYQDDLDTFWLRRHTTARILLERLDDTEEAFTSVVASPT